MDSVRTRVLIITIAAISSLAADRLSAQIGHVIDAVGPINQSMGGAGTALPLDSMGALHWNPASITGLSSELGFGFAAFAPQTELSSRLEAGAFGPGIPATAMEGTTSSDTDISPIPSLGFVCSPEGSDWSYGLGGFAIGGFGVDFPASTTNPILTPQPANGGFGFGSIFSQFQLMQFAPTVAYRWSDRVSLGFAPTINWSTLAISPFSRYDSERQRDLSVRCTDRCCMGIRLPNRRVLRRSVLRMARRDVLQEHAMVSELQI